MEFVQADVDVRHYRILRESVRVMINTLSESYDRLGVAVLDVAPESHAGAREFFRQASVATLDIDPLAEATYTADLCRDNSDLIESGTFDLVICAEVLEHTLKPWLAVDELFRLVRPGGCVAVTSPFNFRIHGPAPDCWRFTESGLRSLLDRFARVDVQEVPDPGRPRMPVHYRAIAYRSRDS